VVLESDPGDGLDGFSKSFSEESVSILAIYGSIRGLYGVYRVYHSTTLAGISSRDIPKKPSFLVYIGQLRPKFSRRS
jgi:hypothetical protein